MTNESNTGQSNSEKNVENQQETAEGSEDIQTLKSALSEWNDKYVRLYAEFENYKKFAAKSREDQIKYANENLLKDLLTVIDHLELALQHSSEQKASDSLTEGVNLTLKELKTVLEKYGLRSIEALGKPFDPSLHHAMAQIDSEDTEENIVVKEFRSGYTYKDRVIRASLVGVSKKQSASVPEEKN